MRSAGFGGCAYAVSTLLANVVRSDSLGTEPLREELARCDREIAEAEATLRSGYTDIDGCLLWLYDWRVERKLIEDEMANTVVTDDVVTRKAGRKKPGDKVSKVMSEFNTGDLKSSAGNKVTNPKQALAIGLSEQRRAKKGAKASSCDCADKAKCSCG